MVYYWGPQEVYTSYVSKSISSDSKILKKYNLIIKQISMYNDFFFVLY